MAKVKFKRTTHSSMVNGIPVEDGSVIITGNGKMFIDYGDNRTPVGGTPDTEMSDDSTNSVENNVVKHYIDNSINNIKSNIVWTNSNPLSDFSTQTITLSSGDYDSLKIIYYDFTDESSRRVKIAEIPKLSAGKKGFIDAILTSTSNTIYMTSRTILFNSDTSLTIGDSRGASSGNVGVINTTCVPIQIIACKQ